MAHDVFISYASKNKQAADAICSELEARGIRCWIAPRDIMPGVPWAESIIDAIETAKVMLLLFSSAANSSDQIHREVERAIHKGISVVPLRLENVLPTRTLEYFISSHHWFDAIEPPLQQHIDRLAQGLTALLVRRTDGRTTRRRRTMSPGPAPASEPGAPSPARRPPAIAASPARASASARAAASATAVKPTILGNYEVGHLLGPGRFGSVVYAGTHRVLGHTVAIRTFQSTPSGNRDAVRTRFLREARALQVPHPNIIQVRDFGESDDLMYVVTDLFAGCNLGELIASEGPLPLQKFQAFVRDLTDATIAVHRHGGFISGLHPEIVRVVREDGREWLAISSAGISTAQDLLAVMNEATLRGQAASSELSYVAPELLMGKTADARADVFTVGVLAYEMATGRTPFQGRSFPELLGAMLGNGPQDLAVVRPDLGPATAAIIMRCLAPDPQHRYAAAAEVLQAWPATAPSGG
jgi:TIR domain-containing protein/protein kinase-like protein